MISKLKSACSHRRKEADIVEHAECPSRYLGGYEFWNRFLSPIKPKDSL